MSLLRFLAITLWKLSLVSSNNTNETPNAKHVDQLMWEELIIIHDYQILKTWKFAQIYWTWTKCLNSRKLLSVSNLLSKAKAVMSYTGATERLDEMNQLQED